MRTRVNAKCAWTCVVLAVGLGGGSGVAEESSADPPTWSTADGKTFRGWFQYKKLDPATGTWEFAFRDERDAWLTVPQARFSDGTFVQLLNTRPQASAAAAGRAADGAQASAIGVEGGAGFAGFQMGSSVQEAARACGGRLEKKSPLLDSDVTEVFSMSGNPRFKGATSTRLEFIGDRLFEVKIDFSQPPGTPSEQLQDGVDRHQVLLEMLTEEFGKPRVEECMIIVRGGSVLPRNQQQVKGFRYVFNGGAGVEVVYVNDEVTATHKALSKEAARQNSANAERLGQENRERVRDAIGGDFGR